MRRQKGQAVVEFALVLPFFLMLVFGIMFVGLLYSDYLTLSNLARESARAAAIQGMTEDDNGNKSYIGIRDQYGKQTRLMTNLYTWTYNDDSCFSISNNEDDTMVTAKLTAQRNDEYPGAGFVKYMLPKDYTIVYSMYKEENVNSGSSS